MYHNNDHTIHRNYVTNFISGSGEASAPAKSSATVYKLTHDPRITPLGRMLRKTSLDEAATILECRCAETCLWWVRGRPFLMSLRRMPPWHRRRLLEARPGITGLWQVEGRSRLSFAEMVRLDLKYTGSWSVWLDLKILMRTPSAVFSGEGAH